MIDRRSYDFRGLEAWQRKFRPQRWEPVFALAPGPCVGLRTLVAITGAFPRRPLAVFAARALGRALASEVRGLVGRPRRRAAAAADHRHGA